MKLSLPPLEKIITPPLNFKINLSDSDFELKNGFNKYFIGNFSNEKISGFFELSINYDEKNKKVKIYGLVANDILEPKFNVYLNNNIDTIITLNNTVKSNDILKFCFNDSESFNYEKTINKLIKSITSELFKFDVNEVLTIENAPIITTENFNEIKGILFTKNNSSMELSLENIMKLQTYLNSIYIGIVTWRSDTTYSNVIGSSQDHPEYGGSWIKLWRERCNNSIHPDQCSSLDYTNGVYNQNFCNRSFFVGGHVIEGTLPRKAQFGEYVYIFPICSTHDNYHNNLKYMTLKKYFTGIVIEYR